MGLGLPAAREGALWSSAGRQHGCRPHGMVVHHQPTATTLCMPNPSLPAVPHTSPLKKQPSDGQTNGKVDGAGHEEPAGVSPPELVEAVIKKSE